MISTLIIAILCQASVSIHVSMNHEALRPLSTVLITQDDSIQLSTDSSGYWMLFKPVFREYDNLLNGTHSIEKIEYKSEWLSTEPSDRINLALPPGTYHMAFSHHRIDTAFSTFHPLIHENADIVQVIVRKDDSYIGYLTELIGLPFVLPPKLIGTHGHQTDLRLGTDCAELAIYGMRRMGHSIPYGGPRGILDYLVRTDALKAGTIVHFGYQVSVLYEDRGETGTLDGEDLLIHAYQDCVKIEELGNTELVNQEYRLYKWKDLKN